MRSELNDQKTLLSSGYTTKSKVASAERTVQQLDSEYADLQSKVEEAKMLVERYELEDKQIDKNFVEQVENELYAVDHEFMNFSSGCRQYRINTRG